MDVSELRSAFMSYGSVIERVRQFRADRIAKIQNNQAPVLFPSGKSQTILHLIPLESFGGPVQYDVVKLSNRPMRLPPVIEGSWSNRINLDGFVSYSGTEQNSMAYTQAFRNGAIEAVEGYWLNAEHGGNRTIPYAAIEGGLLRYLETCFEVQKDLGVTPPIIVALALTRTRSLKMAAEYWELSPASILEENLVLPETVVMDFTEKPGKILKPIFDLIWNACGYPATKTLDNDGNWIFRR